MILIVVADGAINRPHAAVSDEAGHAVDADTLPDSNLVGGTSPFGTRKAMPVHVERSILALPKIYVNGGSRGFLVGIAPADLVRVLSPVPVDAAIEG